MFLTDQYKEIEENNRIGKTRDLFEKNQGNISCKDGYNKGQKWDGSNRSRRLRRSGKNTQKNYTGKVLRTWITTMVTNLEPDILECDVQWALGSIAINRTS